MFFFGFGAHGEHSPMAALNPPLIQKRGERLGEPPAIEHLTKVGLGDAFSAGLLHTFKHDPLIAPECRGNLRACVGVVVG